MDNAAIVERIKYIIKELRYKQTDFARLLKIDVSNLSKYLNYKIPVSEGLVNKIVINLGVSKRWLVDGEDIPFPKESYPQEIVVNAMPADDTCDTTQSATMPLSGGVPVYDVDVTAGTAPRSMMFCPENVVGWVSLPQTLPQNCRIVRVSGDSMQPVIHPGDYIAVRELSNFGQIFWGQIYVVLLDDFRVVKFVRKHKDPDKVILRSANRNYDDMEVLRADIRDLMLVQSILHVDVRI